MALWGKGGNQGGLESLERAAQPARQLVDSFEKLELIMALRRGETRRASITDLAHALDLPRDELRRAVRELQAAGLLQLAHDEVTLAPRAPDAQRAIDELAAVYDADKMVLVKAIAESSIERLRNLAGRAFADAFVIGKKLGGDDDR